MSTSVNPTVNCTGQPNQPASCTGSVTVTHTSGNTSVQGQGQVNTQGQWQVSGSVTHTW